MESTNVLTLLNEVRRDACAKFDPSDSSKPLFEAITTIMHISNVARKEGLLALEEMAYSEKHVLIDDIGSKILLIVDGNWPEIIVESVTNDYWINKYEGNEALRQYILMRGILMVQEGMNPYVIVETLVTLIPKHLHKLCREYIDEKQSELEAMNDAKVAEEYKAWQPISLNKEESKKLVAEFEEIILSMDDRSVQRLLRDVDNYDLIIAMTGLSEKVRNVFLKNMSKRLALMIVDDLLRMSHLYRETEIVETVEKIKNLVHRLEDAGDIAILK